MSKIEPDETEKVNSALLTSFRNKYLCKHPVNHETIDRVKFSRKKSLVVDGWPEKYCRLTNRIKNPLVTVKVTIDIMSDLSDI